MLIHATTVELDGAGLLILGPSGAGKSSLALQMMASGAYLVADDQTELLREGANIVASCPAVLAGRIEARGIGILSVAPSAPVRVAYVVELTARSEDRLPQLCTYELLGTGLPLVRTPYQPHLYAALRLLLLGGRVA